MQRPPLVPALLLILLVPVLAALLLYFPVKNRVASLQDTAVQRVEEALQQNVVLEVGGARLGLRRGLGFRLYDVCLHERGDRQERILEARYLFVGVNLAALLRGDVRIQRIFVLQPRVFLTRDPTGKLNVSRLFSATYARQQARETLQDETLYETFGPLLWRNEISFKNGEIVYGDAGDGGREPIRLCKLDLRVINRLDVDRLDVRIRGEIAAAAVLATLDLQGDISGWKTVGSLEELTSAIRLSLEGDNLQELADRFHVAREGDELRGAFTGVLAYEGSLLLPGKGHLELVLEQPHISLRRIHPHPFSPDRVDVVAPFEANRDEITFSQGQIRLAGMPIRWDAAFLFQGRKLNHLDVDLAADDLPLMEAKSYLPLGLLRGEAWRFLTAMVRAGRVDATARLRGAPEDFSRLGAPEGEDAFQLRLRFRDCTVVLPVQEPYLPFHSTEGVLELHKGTVHFRGFRASYGRTPIPEIHGSIRNVHRSVSHLSVEALAHLFIPETFQEMDHGIFPDAIRRVGRSFQEADGGGRLSIGIDYTYGRNREGRLSVHGEATLEDVRARCVPLGLSVTGMNGRIAFDESSVSFLDMHLMADRSPVQVAGSVRFGKAADGATGEVRFDSPLLRAADLFPRLGLGEQVRGPLRARAVLAWDAGVMGWKGTLQGEELELLVGSFSWQARDMLLTLEGSEDSLVVPSFRATLEGSELAGEGRWSSLRPLNGRVDLRSAALDLDRLVGQRTKEKPRGDRISTDVLGIFQAREKPGGSGIDVRFGLKCDRLFYRDFDASDVVLEGRATSERLHVQYAHGTYGGGGFIVQGEAALDDPRIPFSMLFGLNEVRTEAYWQWFTLTPGFLEGTASVEGSLRGNLRPSGTWWKDLHGTFSLYSEGSTIRRYELLSKILTLVHFTQWTRVRLSDLYARGVPCRQIAGNLRLHSGSLSTENLVMDTSIARVTLRGTYDIVQDRMDTEMTLQPMEQLDQVLDYLPVLGRVIRGPDGTTVLFHYALRGPLKDLSVELIPFRALNNRIGTPFRRLNRWLQNLDDRLQGRQAP